MAMTINGTNGVTFNDGTSMVTGQQACKAWVNFNGTGVVAIRAGFNVSSITDNGVGDYTINFTTAMPDANYSAVGTGSRSSGTLHASVMINPDVAPTTSGVRIRNLAGTDGVHDPLYCHVAIFR